MTFLANVGPLLSELRSGKINEIAVNSLYSAFSNYYCNQDKSEISLDACRKMLTDAAASLKRRKPFDEVELQLTQPLSVRFIKYAGNNVEEESIPGSDAVPVIINLIMVALSSVTAESELTVQGERDLARVITTLYLYAKSGEGPRLTPTFVAMMMAFFDNHVPEPSTLGRVNKAEAKGEAASIEVNTVGRISPACLYESDPDIEEGWESTALVSFASASIVRSLPASLGWKRHLPLLTYKGKSFVLPPHTIKLKCRVAPPSVISYDHSLLPTGLSTQEAGETQRNAATPTLYTGTRGIIERRSSVRVVSKAPRRGRSQSVSVRD